jgi:hypothetical protein
MSVTNWKELKSHRGHDVELVGYTDKMKRIIEMCLECQTCGEVLFDWVEGADGRIAEEF